LNAALRRADISSAVTVSTEPSARVIVTSELRARW
jgi:hypothetical protein